MMKFLSLLEFELGRFLKFLIPTFILSAVLQFFSLFQTINYYEDYLQNAMETNSIMEKFSMHDVTGSGLFTLSILFIPLLFVFYSLFTWYREWLGKNTFIYRLLMLPINRLSIFFAKALAFVIGGFLAFVGQFGLYAIISALLKNAIESEHFTALSIHNVQPPYEIFQQVLFPETGFEFFHTYGYAFAALLVLFTAILIERSFGLKGAIAGLIYFASFFTGHLLINALQSIDILPWTVRPSHIFLMKCAYLILAMIFSSWISQWLLKNKVRV